MIFDSIFHYSKRFLLLPPFPSTKNSVLISDLTSVVKPQFLLNSPVLLALADRQVGFPRLAVETGNDSTVDWGDLSVPRSSANALLEEASLFSQVIHLLLAILCSALYMHYLISSSQTTMTKVPLSRELSFLLRRAWS